MFNIKYAEEYISLVKKEPEKYYKDYLKLLDDVAHSNAIYKEKPVPVTYQGLFYDQKDRENFTQLCKTLMDITQKVTHEYLKNPEYRKLFGFSKELEELILHDPGYDITVPIARYDVFYNGMDKFKFIEFNTDGSSAMNKDNTVGDLLIETLVMKEFMQKYDIECVDMFHPWIEESTKIYESVHHRKPNIAIVDFLDIGATYEFKKFRQLFMESGYNCEIFDIRDLKYVDGNLVCGDFKIDMVYRRAVTVEYMKHYSEMKDFTKAYLDNAFMLIGSFRSQIMHTKLIFKILLDPLTQNILTDYENKFLEEHIPFTDYFDERVYEEVLENKDQYIVKPVDDYASHGVYAGRGFSKEEWSKLLDEALVSDYIYQKYYEMEPLPFLEFDDSGEIKVSGFTAVLGMFIYNGKFIAPYTRIGQNSTVGGADKHYVAPNMFIKK